MTEEEIRDIEERREPMRLVTVAAPRSGVVLHRGVSLGTAVDPSTEIVTVADLSKVWVLAEVPESDIPEIGMRMKARLDFPSSGRPSFPASVAFLYPTLTERTRTLRVRFVVSNPRGSLRPGLYGTAEFEVAPRRVLTVPRDAVVDTGLEQHVFVATGPGGFAPRKVELGARLEDKVEVLEGLQEGEEIVSSGAFLIDSESRLRASGGTGAGHSGHGAPPAESAETKGGHDLHRD
jgi:RND family efflux transporter MFP subunit